MTSKPQVSQVVWSLEPAGAERMVFDVIQCLRDRYEFRLVAPGGGGAMEKEFRALGIEVVVGPSGMSKFALLQFLSRELRAHRPDLLHTHLGADVWAGMVARVQRLKPWLSTAHNDDRDDPWLRHMLRRRMASKPDQTICVSHVVKRYVQNEFGVPLHKLTVVPNGIDLTSIEIRPPRSLQDVPKLLSVGRLTKQKGHDTLLRALARVKRPWHLDICGDGPDRFRLERLTESLGLLPRVTFLGVVNDIKRRLSEADVFCFPSRWEGQGIAMLEAAASATPMLLSDLPVFHEWFDSSSALFAPVDQVERWTESVEDLLRHPTEAVKRATQARKIVLERGSRESMAEQYHQLYQRWLDTYAHPSRQ